MAAVAIGGAGQPKFFNGGGCMSAIGFIFDTRELRHYYSNRFISVSRSFSAHFKDNVPPARAAAHKLSPKLHV